MDKGFIQSKINIPKVRNKLVKRSALFGKLNEAINYKLTLITAPAGFGKSTLASSWLNFNVKNKFLISWVSLDERDDNPLIFWKYILYSFNQACEGSVENSLAAINSFKYGVKKEILSIIINDLCNIEKELFLVIDDLYLLQDKEIHEELKYFIRNMPPNIHIIILSRSIPEIGIGRLRATDCLLELTQEDLSFGKEEIEMFFKDIMGVNVSDNILEVLEKRTEGWAAGLQMAALSLKNNNNEKNIIKYFNGNHKFVLEYLIEEVFNLLDTETQEFLMKTSILDQMNHELCNKVVNIENSQHFLEKLDNENLFIIHLDENMEWYRYHHLFKDFLRNRRDISIKSDLDNLYNSAAEWYKFNGFYSRGIDFYLEAKNYDEAISIIEKIDMDLIFSGEMKKIYDWYMAIPKSKFYENLRICIGAAWFTCVNGNIKDSEAYLKHIEKLLEVKNNEEKIKLYNKEIMMIRAAIAVLEKNSSKIIEYLKLAKDCSGHTNNLLDAAAALVNGFAFIYIGNVLKALECYEECLEISKKMNNYYIAIRANKSIIISKMYRGKLHEAEKQCMNLLEYLSNRNADKIPIAGVIYNDLAGIYYELNDLNRCTKCVRKALELGEKGEISWVLCTSYMLLAKIFFAFSNKEEAIKYVKKAENIIEDSKLCDAKVDFEVTKQNMLLRNGSNEVVKKWLASEGFDMAGKYNMKYAYYYVTKLRYLILNNILDEGEELAHNLLEYYKLKKVYKIYAEVLILKSIMYEKKANRKESLKCLIEAINISAEENYSRIFLDEGDNLKNIILSSKNKLQSNLGKEEKLFLNKIMKSFNEAHYVSELDINNILSAREAEILKYLKARLTNAEIADSLFVSVNTVKTHLLNIYTKLDVHSRREALAKVSELGILKG